MELYKLFRHNVRITFTDGQVLEGFVNSYVSDEDNEPDPEYITIGNIGITEEEIDNVEILD